MWKLMVTGPPSLVPVKKWVSERCCESIRIIHTVACAKSVRCFFSIPTNFFQPAKIFANIFKNMYLRDIVDRFGMRSEIISENMTFLQKTNMQSLMDFCKKKSWSSIFSEIISEIIINRSAMSLRHTFLNLKFVFCKN